MIRSLLPKNFAGGTGQGIKHAGERFRLRKNRSLIATPDRRLYTS